MLFIYFIITTLIMIKHELYSQRWERTWRWCFVSRHLRISCSSRSSERNPHRIEHRRYEFWKMRSKASGSVERHTTDDRVFGLNGLWLERSSWLGSQIRFHWRTFPIVMSFLKSVRLYTLFMELRCALALKFSSLRALNFIESRTVIWSRLSQYMKIWHSFHFR